MLNKSKFLISLLLSATIANAGLSAAQAGGSGKLESDSRQLVNAVQQSLTMQGKWPPPAGSQEMQLCTALQLFTQEVKNSPNLSSGSQSASSQNQMAMQRLQASAASVDGLIGAAGSSAEVSQRWFSIKNELAALSANTFAVNPYMNNGFNQGINPNFNPNFNSGFNPGFRPGFNPGFNSGFNPGFNSNFTNGFNPAMNQEIKNNPYFNPNAMPGTNPYYNPYAGSNSAGNLSSAFSQFADAVQDFTGFAQKNIQSFGAFGTNPNQVFAAATALQSLQQAAKAASRSVSRANNYGVAQMEFQQVSNALQQYEQAFNQTQPAPQLQMRYSKLKMSFASLQAQVQGLLR